MGFRLTSGSTRPHALALVIPLALPVQKQNPEENSVRKHLNKTRNSKKRLHRLSFTTATIAAAILAIGAVTVASRQKLSNIKAGKPAVNTAHNEFAAVPGHGHEIADQASETSQLTPKDAEKLAAGLGPMVKPTAEGLVPVQHGDGSVSINLEDHYQNVTVARINQNGSLTQSCVDNPQAAGAFFGIDPKLIEQKSRAAAAPAGRENR